MPQIEYKFRIGQRVQVIAESDGWGRGVSAGDIGIVRAFSATEPGKYLVDFITHPSWSGTEACFVSAEDEDEEDEDEEDEEDTDDAQEDTEEKESVKETVDILLVGSVYTAKINGMRYKIKIIKSI